MGRFRIFLLTCCCVLQLKAFAQDNDFRQAYEDFRKQAKSEYEDFRSKANADYAEFVKQAWTEYKKLPEIPKPKDEAVPPVVMPEEDKGKPIEDKKQGVVEVVPVIDATPQPVPPAPIKEQPMPVEEYKTFTFFGTAGKVRWDDSMKFHLQGANEKSIANGWTTLSDVRYDNIIRDCLTLRMQYNLCDWAYLQMLEKMAGAVCGAGTNEATLLMAYVYCQSGYKMRLANSGGRLCMLYASKHGIYEKGYFELDGEQFYPYGETGATISICEASFPKEQSMSLLIPQTPEFAWQGCGERTLKSERYPSLTVKTMCNKNMIDFYSSYPTSEIDGNFMTRWAMYANTPMEEGVSNELYPALRLHIAGLSKKEAVERLLNWVQTAFVYEYDDKVWGGDRAFFPEESLYYPYCDCEDRSILFTRLVRDLLGLKCILVYYPGHLASAVCFDDETVNGDYIQLGGKRYVVCDPTYINAPVGSTMPQMDNAEAKVILLR